MSRAFVESTGGLNAGFYRCNVLNAEFKKTAEEYTRDSYSLDLTFIIEGASYKQNKRYFFDIEKDATTGKIVKNKDIIKLNIKLDTLNYPGGFNIDGIWEGREGEHKQFTQDKDITMDLLEHIVLNVCDEDKPIEYPFICYCYYSKKEGKDKAFFTVYDFVKAGGSAESKFRTHVQEAIGKGYIVNAQNNNSGEQTSQNAASPTKRTTRI